MMVKIIHAQLLIYSFPWQPGPYHPLLHPLHAHVAKVSLSASFIKITNKIFIVKH